MRGSFRNLLLLSPIYLCILLGACGSKSQPSSLRIYPSPIPSKNLRISSTAVRETNLRSGPLENFPGKPLNSPSLNSNANASGYAGLVQNAPSTGTIGTSIPPSNPTLKNMAVVQEESPSQAHPSFEIPATDPRLVVHSVPNQVEENFIANVPPQPANFPLTAPEAQVPSTVIPLRSAPIPIALPLPPNANPSAPADQVAEPIVVAKVSPAVSQPTLGITQVIPPQAVIPVALGGSTATDGNSSAGIHPSSLIQEPLPSNPPTEVSTVEEEPAAEPGAEIVEAEEEDCLAAASGGRRNVIVAGNLGTCGKKTLKSNTLALGDDGILGSTPTFHPTANGFTISRLMTLRFPGYEDNIVDHVFFPNSGDTKLPGKAVLDYLGGFADPTALPPLSEFCPGRVARLLFLGTVTDSSRNAADYFQVFKTGKLDQLGITQMEFVDFPLSSECEIQIDYPLTPRGAYAWILIPEGIEATRGPATVKSEDSESWAQLQDWIKDSSSMSLPKFIASEIPEIHLPEASLPDFPSIF